MDGNQQQKSNTQGLIAQLKEVFSTTELKVIVNCLQKLKQGKNGTQDNITNVLRSLKLAVFKDQKNPKETDKKFEGKQACLVNLLTYIPHKFKT